MFRRLCKRWESSTQPHPPIKSDLSTAEYIHDIQESIKQQAYVANQTTTSNISLDGIETPKVAQFPCDSTETLISASRTNLSCFISPSQERKVQQRFL